MKPEKIAEKIEYLMMIQETLNLGTNANEALQYAIDIAKEAFYERIKFEEEIKMKVQMIEQITNKQVH